jgi:hypothetical protein
MVDNAFGSMKQCLFDELTDKNFFIAASAKVMVDHVMDLVSVDLPLRWF